MTLDLCSRVLAHVRRTIAGELRRLPAAGAPDGRRVLDVGCWDGTATGEYARILAARPLGIEIFDGPARAAEAAGVEVARVDLESGRFPWPDESVDVVICNQVLEHLKNIWLPMSEMYRVLRVGGHAVLSVPNLGSLHNRVMLAFGRQPTSIRTFGPHVRGYTLREFRRFVARDEALEVVRVRGVGFHPVPAPFSAPLAALWPGASHTIVIVARKARAGTPPWSAYIGDQLAAGLQTHY
jgi:methionine biosynthesis protein MetW